MLSGGTGWYIVHLTFNQGDSGRRAYNGDDIHTDDYVGVESSILNGNIFRWL